MGKRKGKGGLKWMGGGKVGRKTTNSIAIRPSLAYIGFDLSFRGGSKWETSKIFGVLRVKRKGWW